MPRKAGQFDGNHVAGAAGAVDTEFSLAHGLNRVPLEAFVVTSTGGAIVYRSTTAWDSTNLYLKSNVANTGFVLFVI